MWIFTEWFIRITSVCPRDCVHLVLKERLIVWSCEDHGAAARFVGSFVETSQSTKHAQGSVILGMPFKQGAVANPGRVVWVQTARLDGVGSVIECTCGPSTKQRLGAFFVEVDLTMGAIHIDQHGQVFLLALFATLLLVLCEANRRARRAQDAADSTAFPVLLQILPAIRTVHKEHGFRNLVHVNGFGLSLGLLANGLLHVCGLLDRSSTLSRSGHVGYPSVRLWNGKVCDGGEDRKIFPRSLVIKEAKTQPQQMKADKDDIQILAYKQGEQMDDEGRKVACFMKMEDMPSPQPVVPSYRIAVLDEATKTYEHFLPEDVIEIRCMGSQVNLVLLRKGDGTTPPKKDDEDEPKRKKPNETAAEGCAWCTRSKETCICGVGPDEG